MPDMVHFLTEYGLFAMILAQMNLKESDKSMCGKQQDIFENHAKSELEHLHTTESNLIKIL